MARNRGDRPGSSGRKRLSVTPEVFVRSWFLSGPTAAGKTAVGVELAALIGAEIVSMDSMALYRGMDVGTAKPTTAERSRVAHHLVDVVDASREFSVAQYFEAAACCVREIESRGRTPLFVGGTPLYLKSLLRGLSEAPGADWAIRQRLLAQARSAGAESLHRQLAAIDPESAARLHPNDLRRVVRAIEVFERTVLPLSQLQTHAHPPQNPVRAFVLVWPRALLHRRIDRRVDEMFRAGFVDEVARLRVAGGMSRTALQAVGYAEVLDHLGGRISEQAAIALIKTRTRQFAKRQMTWFRSLRECQMVDVEEPLDPRRVAQRIATLGRSWAETDR